jgi:hypothetical protein
MSVNEVSEDKFSLSLDFIAPLEQMLDNDTVLKTVQIFAKYRYENDIIRYSSSYKFPADEVVGLSDLELFETFKEFLGEPADEDDEDEVGLTQQQLLSLRDPEGLRDLPFESEKVQKFIADGRKINKEEFFEDVKNIFQKVVDKIKSKNQPFTIEHLEVRVIYAKKPDLSKDLPFKISYTNTPKQAG